MPGGSASRSNVQLRCCQCLLYASIGGGSLPLPIAPPPAAANARYVRAMVAAVRRVSIAYPAPDSSM